MPTYTYECPKCGKAFDIFHGMSENPRIKCSECNVKAKRLLGMGAGIIFKGAGFYETDYKNKGAKGAAASESKNEAKSETKTEAKSETKTEAKSESKSSSKSDGQAADKGGKSA